MTWRGIKKTNDSVLELKAYVIGEFEKIYQFDLVNDNIVFALSDNLFMSIDTIQWDENLFCLVMSYGESPDLRPDDGDTYYIDDYDTPEELFDAMLKETQR